MKAYHFRLATVARIRALEQRVARDRFMVASRDLRRAQEAHRGAEAALAALDPPAGLVTMADVSWIGDQAERLSDTVRACNESVDDAASRRADAHRAWNLATKRAGVLERLDDQGLSRWRDASQRQESAELDDLSTARYGSAGPAQ